MSKVGGSKVGEAQVGGDVPDEAGTSLKPTKQNKQNIGVVFAVLLSVIFKELVEEVVGVVDILETVAGIARFLTLEQVTAIDAPATPMPIKPLKAVHGIADTIRLPFIRKQFTPVFGTVERYSFRTGERFSELIGMDDENFLKTIPVLSEVAAKAVTEIRFGVTKQVRQDFGLIDILPKTLNRSAEELIGLVDDVRQMPIPVLSEVLPPVQKINFGVTDQIKQKIGMVERETNMPIIDFDQDIVATVERIRQNVTKQLTPIVAPVHGPNFQITRPVVQTVGIVEDIRQGPIVLIKETIDVDQIRNFRPTLLIKETVGTMDFLNAFLQGVRRRVIRSRNNVTVITGELTATLSDLRNDFRVLNPFNDVDVSDRRNDAEVVDEKNDD